MKKIAIIGASYLQLPLVLKAKEMEIETHCFAWEEGAVCRDFCDFFYPISILDKEKILVTCKKIKIDGITSIASDAAVPTICFVAENLGLISNEYIDAVVTTNKYEMRKRFELNSVNSPRFIFADKNITIDSLNYPLIVKPTDRSGSRGVTRVENIEQLKDALIIAQNESFRNQAIIEEFIHGVEASVESISWNGEHYILAITDKVTTGNPHFVELEHHQPSLLSSNIQKIIKEETYKALTALNIKYGASHSEFKITEDGKVYVIEVGARMGGDFIGSDLVQLSTGFDFVKAVIEIALGNFENPSLKNAHYSGVYFLCKQTSRINKIIQSTKFYPEIIRAEITDSTLRNVKSSSERSGYFIYQSDKKFIV
jgi:biotin carboxylase